MSSVSRRSTCFLLLAFTCASGSTRAALTTSFDPAPEARYRVLSDADDAMVISCGVPPGPFQFPAVLVNGQQIGPAVACADVVVFDLQGGPGANLLDVNAVTEAAGFSAFTGSRLSGAEGEDTLRGSERDDSMRGDAGDDRLIGFAGDDVALWRAGDGSDRIDLGQGRDVLALLAAEINDHMVIDAGADVRVRGLKPTLFTLDLEEVELLDVQGRGGDDHIDASSLPSGRIALQVDGGSGQDRLEGSQGDDQLMGGAGEDEISSGPGSDLVEGGDGDDRMIWSAFDGSDNFNGGAGQDRMVVNASDDEQQGDALRVSDRGALFQISGLPGGFGLNVERAEQLEVNTLDGEDEVDTTPLDQVVQYLDGGNPTSLPGDVLRVDGKAVALAESPLGVTGGGAIHHVNFEFQGAVSPTPLESPRRVPITGMPALVLLTLGCFVLAYRGGRHGR